MDTVFYLLLALLVFYFLWNGYKASIERNKKCVHGVVGAFHNYRMCSVCREEEQQRQKEQIGKRRKREQQERLQRQEEYQKYLKNIRLPSYLQEMNPFDFEKLCCNLFRKFGYEVELTPKTGDGGIDAFLRKDGDFGILQAKRYKGAVGEPVLRDLYGAMHDKKAKHAVVVTTGKVSPSAVKWADDKPIRLIELAELVKLITESFTEGEVVTKDFVIPEKKLTKCPQCYRKLVKRKGKYGSFWGCTGFPECRYTRNIKRDFKG